MRTGAFGIDVKMPPTAQSPVGQNVGDLKSATLIVALILVAACGASSTATKQSPLASPSASASAAQPPSSPTASQQASPSAPAVGGYEALVTVGSADTYAVSLVGVDGKVVASAQPSSPTQVTCGDAAAAVLPPPVSTSNTRVYFLDQQGNVNFLTPNGETGQEYRLPTGGSTRSLFAVSPDDSLIAVVVITFTANGATTKLYMDQLLPGGSQKLLFTQTGAYTLWPIGWHGTDNLVLAKVPACTQGGGPLCCGPLELHVVDPSTAARRFTIGSSQCVIAGMPSPAGAVCENSPAFSQASVLDWTGHTVRSFAVQGPTSAYLSPDGRAVALVDSSSTTFEGAKQTLDLLACGWIDSTHVIAGGDTQQQPRVGDTTTGSLLPVAAQGICGGRIPGGL